MSHDYNQIQDVMELECARIHMALDTVYCLRFLYCGTTVVISSSSLYYGIGLGDSVKITTH